jgi:hypothetical protein
METPSVCQLIVVDWDCGTYAAVETWDDDENWAKAVCTERRKGRNVHCFSHDAADTAGLQEWARQHELTRADVASVLATV